MTQLQQRGAGRGTPLVATEFVQALELVVHSHQLLTDVPGVLQSGQVEQDLRVVGGHGQGPPEALDGGLQRVNIAKHL